jgi:sRNA-binding protein
MKGLQKMAYVNRAAVEPIIELLEKHYPGVFFVDPKRRVPIGVTVDDLVNDAFPVHRSLLEQTLEWYYSHVGIAYKTTAGSPVYNLKGKITGTVTEAAQYEAQKKLKAFHDKVNAQRNTLDTANNTRSEIRIVEKEIPPKIAPELVPLYEAMMGINPMFLGAGEGNRTLVISLEGW